MMDLKGVGNTGMKKNSRSSPFSQALVKNSRLALESIPVPFCSAAENCKVFNSFTCRILPELHESSIQWEIN